MSIHHEVTLEAAPERIYELLTNGAKFGEVTGRPGRGGGSAGSAFYLFDDWLEGRQIELVRNERIVQAWRFMDWDPGVYSIVRFTLSPDGTGTRLVMDQIGVPQDFHEHVKTNWSEFYFRPFSQLA